MDAIKNADDLKLHGICSVARLVGRHPSTVIRWVKTGTFPPPDVVIADRQHWTTRTLREFTRGAKHRRDDAA
jgi:hypothetical protein